LVGDLTSSRRDPPRLIFGEWLNRRARQRAFGRYGGAATKLPAENDDARADEFCALAENSTGFEIFDNDRETKSVDVALRC
jgi:hypothetical protein